MTKFHAHTLISFKDLMSCSKFCFIIHYFSHNKIQLLYQHKRTSPSNSFRDKLKTRPYKHKGATCGLQERRRFFPWKKSRPGKRLVAIKIQSRFGTHFSFCRPGSFSDGLKKDIYIEREDRGRLMDQLFPIAQHRCTWE